MQPSNEMTAQDSDEQSEAAKAFSELPPWEQQFLREYFGGVLAGDASDKIEDVGIEAKGDVECR